MRVMVQEGDMLNISFEGLGIELRVNSVKLFPEAPQAERQTAAPVASAVPKEKSNRISAAGRARIAEAARHRWATARLQSGTQPAAADAAAKSPKRQMSPEARARIIAANKARWAEYRKSKKR